MTPRRAALLERFRVRAQERMAELAVAIEAHLSPDDPAWAALMGDLHTLKGESRMLGLISAAALAHAIEERLHAPPIEDVSEDVEARVGVEDALAQLVRILGGELVEDERAAALAEQGLGMLNGDPRDGSQTSGVAKRPADAAPLDDRGARVRFVNVEESAIDALCTELEEVRAMVARAAIVGTLAGHTLDDLRARVERVTEDAWTLRLTPIGPSLTTLAEHAVDLAREQGKRIHVVVDAEGAALEHAVLDALAEPLLHLVRNAIDHGIEPPERRGDKDAVARLWLSAESRGDSVMLFVSDDGAGIDADAVVRAALSGGRIDAARAATMDHDEKLDLVFLERLSTRESVSDVSGRGVGLDVVRRVVESMGGTAHVTSTLGTGTRFALTVPVALARERILLVEVGLLCVGIAARHVESVVTREANVHESAGGTTLATTFGLVPLRSFAALLRIETDIAETHAIIVRVNERRWALSVSSLGGERDVLRRPADRGLRALGIAAASAVLDDGRAVLIPTLADVLRRDASAGAAVIRAHAPRTRTRLRRALVVDDSPIVRDLVAELLISAGFDVSQARDGEDALERLASRSFDVIVSDVEMPRCDGLELVRRARARGVRTPIVMVTTRGSADDRMRANELGANGYVVKTDFHEGDLVAVVTRLAEGAP